MDLIGEDRIGDRIVGLRVNTVPSRLRVLERARGEEMRVRMRMRENAKNERRCSAIFRSMYVCMNVIYENKEWNFEVRVIDLSSLMLV